MVLYIPSLVNNNSPWVNPPLNRGTPEVWQLRGEESKSLNREPHKVTRIGRELQLVMAATEKKRQI